MVENFKHYFQKIEKDFFPNIKHNSHTMLEKYKPTKFSEVIGNKTTIQSLGKWFLTWPSPPISNCALVSGPCGVGKTLVIDMLTKQPEYNVMEVNSDDERNDRFMRDRVVPFTKTKKNVWGKSNVLVVNDVDVSNDHGFLGALCACIKETKIPIILTCNERYEPKIKTLAGLCADFKFYKPTSMDICRYITDIVKKELNTPRLTTKQTQLIQTSAETAEGDVRNAILSTEFALAVSETTTTKSKSTNKKDTIKSNLFELTTDFMSQMTEIDAKLELFNMEKDLLPLMVYENYPTNIIKTKTPQEKLYHLSFASNAMSDYDVMPYDSGSSAILQATTVCHASSKVNFTKYLGKLSTRTKKANITTELESKLQPTVPAGHFRLDYMSYMLMILYNQISSPPMFVDKCVSFGFSKEDIQDNLSALLMAEGVYSRCAYEAVDKKVKTTLTKLFTQQQKMVGDAPKTKAKASPKSSTKTTKSITPTAEKKATAAKKATTASKKAVTAPPVEVSVPTPPPQPQPTPTPTKTATIFRKKSTKTTATESAPLPVSTPIQTPTPVIEPTPPPVPAPEKPKTIVRKRAPKNTPPA